MPELPIRLENLDVLVFDFDGVLTNNLVHLDQNGNEWVSCHRGDGLAFDSLRKLNKPVFILSTEKNAVVTARANKLKIPALQAVDDKVAALEKLADTKGFNLDRVLYVGNDLNDYRVMQLCGYSACPADSHQKIREVATVILRSRGGEGVARELLEEILNVDLLKILY